MPLDRAGEAAIFIEGNTLPEDRERFLTKVSPFHSGMVILNSPGGSAYAGIEIGKAIRLRNFATWVPSDQECSSACAIAWLGGHQKTLNWVQLRSSAFTQLGRGTEEKGERQESGFGNALVGAYFAQLGLSEDAIYHLTKARPET